MVRMGPGTTCSSSISAVTPMMRCGAVLIPGMNFITGSRKARTRGQIRFSLRLFSFFYGLLILWFILHRKLSAKYRDWAEKFSRKRFFQALLFTPLLVLTIGVLQL